MAFVAAILIAIPASAQNFSCRYGTEPACLDYGDTVCSSRGKCVDRDAACFDSYQCDFEGFTCKSNLTECAGEYDILVMKHNGLVDDYNDLLDENEDLKANITSVSDCLRYASDLDEARSCVSN